MWRLLSRFYKNGYIQNEAVMIFLFFCLQAAVQVLSEGTPPLPQDVQVDGGQLTWTPGSEDADLTYRVEYLSSDQEEWTAVPGCEEIPSHSCSIAASIAATAEHDCVMLRVQVQRAGLRSTAVRACSTHGDSCSPRFSLTPGPGSLTVHLSRNNSLARRYADYAKHRICFGKEGEPLRFCRDAAASESLSELEAGQRYCVQVQHILWDEPFGPAGCSQCETVRASDYLKQAAIIAGVVVAVGLVVLVPVVAYLLIFQLRKVKQLLRPPCEISLFLEPGLKAQIPILSNTEDHYDRISSISPPSSPDSA
ncbi:interferon gamma receptor 2 [Odontesthes bonariensis]|uniref:interferon gamma receptor 2 n=1 Tax=Odontesthes bonariensis TaxID=219752 RepID=UPI003F5862B2